ncbi:MAG: hypothetical protein CM15mP84_08450 [Cellvibrionales bacterium]|nr:MAG: hypothetical protein CM15mP84_08450 [Cellvibrionales bacterium]
MMEHLTHDMANKARELMAEIDELVAWLRR